jgi:hypothetical protein
MTAFSMDAAHSTPSSADDNDHSHERQRQTAEASHGETWSFSSDAPAEGGSSDSSPHVSLFSPGVPSILPSTSPDVATGSTRAHAGNFTLSSSSSRSLPPLGSIANMTKRTTRLKVSDTHPPIVQLHTRIPEAQKSGDDPTTPLESPSRKRTTLDLMPSEQSTMTSLSKLFSGTPMMPGSRAPSYNNATGPLYLRGMFPMQDYPTWRY